jgi:16S rRNA (guanine(527)-N(7))-methyltransferase RsmG
VFKELLAREFAPYGRLDQGQLARLEQHYHLLLRWNQRMNLTRISSIEEAVRFHYCESLFLGKCLPEGLLRIADVGSGAGFPGIPVAVLRSECRVTLIESNHRKSVFLREASRGLPNIEVLAERAEDVRKRFDWLTARAVTPRDVLKFHLAPNIAFLISATEAGQLGGVDGKRAIPWGRERIIAFASFPP